MDEGRVTAGTKMSLISKQDTKYNQAYQGDINTQSKLEWINIQTELQPVDASFFHRNKTLWGNKATSTQSVQKTLGGASGDWDACNKHGWRVLFLRAEWSSLRWPLCWVCMEPLLIGAEAYLPASLIARCRPDSARPNIHTRHACVNNAFSATLRWHRNFLYTFW